MSPDPSYFNNKDTFNKTGYRHYQCQIDLYNLPVSEVMKHVYRI